MRKHLKGLKSTPRIEKLLSVLEPEAGQVLPYEQQKIEFERHNFKVITPGCYFNTKEEVVIRSQSQLIESYCHINCFIPKRLSKAEKDDSAFIQPLDQVEKICFIKKWINDDKIRKYEKAEMIPPPNTCDSETFNLWRGFEIEKYEHKEDMKEGLDKIYKHILRLSGENIEIKEYLLNWIAMLFQMPGTKPLVMPIIRSKQGLGKEILFSILSNIIGQYYCWIGDDIGRDVVGQFNERMANKILVFMDELTKNKWDKNSESLKTFITGRRIEINGKNKGQRGIPSYVHAIGLSNYSDPVTMSDDNRRLQMIDASMIDVPSKEEMDDLWCLSRDNKVLYSFYKEMLARDLTNWDPMRSRVHTDFEEDLKEDSRSWEEGFMIQYLESLFDHRSGKIYVKMDELFKDFGDYVESNYSKEQSTKLMKIPFSKRVGSLHFKGVERKRTNKDRGLEIDLIEAKKDLIKRGLIKPQFLGKTE